MPNEPELEAIPLFAGLPDPLIAAIRAQKCRVLADGEALFSQGEHAKAFFVMLNGYVKILRGDTQLTVRGPYSILGEQAFINQSTRSATAVAQGTAKCIEIAEPVAAELLTDPVFSRNLLVAVSEKLTEATNERAFRYRNEEMLFAEFRAHVSDSVAQELLASGKAYGAPRLIDAVLLMADIRDFSSLSTRMEPRAIEAQLTPYLDMVVETVHACNGMVDKFIGDAVLAVWGWADGDDATQEQSARNAFRCARQMVEMAQTMEFGGQPIRIGVGLNAGPVFIGNVGGEAKRQFTVLGAPVNLAARLEAHTKESGTAIVAGPDFVERLPDTEGLTRLGEFHPKGSLQPMRPWGWTFQERP